MLQAEHDAFTNRWCIDNDDGEIIRPVAIFYSQRDALEYLEFKNKKNKKGKKKDVQKQSRSRI